jgi:hypothetical protein
MDGQTLVILEMTLTAGLCLGFGFYQLWSLKRDKQRALHEDEKKAKEASTTEQ